MRLFPIEDVVKKYFLEWLLRTEFSKHALSSDINLVACSKSLVHTFIFVKNKTHQLLLQ